MWIGMKRKTPNDATIGFLLLPFFPHGSHKSIAIFLIFMIRFSLPQSFLRFFSRTPSLSGYDQRVLSVLGSQWGDEGKGKLVDILV